MAAAEMPAKETLESEDTGEEFVGNFKNTSMNLVERFLKNCFKFEEFKHKYYPEIYKSDPDLLKDVHSQFLAQLKEKIVNDLDGFCNDQQIYQKLKELKKLNDDAKPADVEAWRPSGDVSEDIRDQRFKQKLAHKKMLESLLESRRSEVEQLKKQCLTEHEEIIALREKIYKQNKQNNEDIEVNQLDMIESNEKMDSSDTD